MTVAIEWQDGTIDEGPTPESVVQVIADTQWHPHTPQEMIRSLSDRAWAVGQNAIDPELPLAEFFLKLEAAGVCRILEWNPMSPEDAGDMQATSRRLSMRARRERS
ncbi:MAG: hypothetical protein WCI12_05745 [Actinomycetes bacterium]